MQNPKEDTGTWTYKMATPKQMVAGFKKDLAKTPKWKWLTRNQLKRNIEFWSKQK